MPRWVDNNHWWDFLVNCAIAIFKWWWKMKLTGRNISSSPETIIVTVIAIIILWSFLKLSAVQVIILTAIIAFLYFRTRRK